MSAANYSTMADAALAAVRGTGDAQRVLHEIRQGVAPPDALLEALRAVLATGDDHRLAGFCREIGKAIERAR